RNSSQFVSLNMSRNATQACGVCANLSHPRFWTWANRLPHPDQIAIVSVPDFNQFGTSFAEIINAKMNRKELSTSNPCSDSREDDDRKEAATKSMLIEAKRAR